MLVRAMKLWVFAMLAGACVANSSATSSATPPATSAVHPAPGPAGSVALSAEPQFESIAEGRIPRAVVAALAQDAAGFLWIATGDGLVRFDGYRLRPQELDAQRPIERNLGWVRALVASADGRVWIGTEARGLAVFDPKTDRISLCQDLPAAATPALEGAADTALPTAPAILALAEGRDGAIWIGSLGLGLQRFEPASGRTTRIASDGRPGSLPDDRVEALRVDRHGDLWVGTWQGLSRRRAGATVFEPVPGLAARQVQALWEAEDGRIWAGTQQGDVFVIEPATLLARQLARQNGAAGAAVTAFTQATQGPVWVGRTRGIDWFDAASGQPLRQLRYEAQRPQGLAGNQVTALLTDRAGAVWVGGLGVGLQRHDPRQSAISVRSADSNTRSPLAELSLRALLALDDGQVWAANEGDGVAVLDAQLRARGSLPKLDAPVDALAQQADGIVWAAAGDALYRFNRAGQRLPTQRPLTHPGGQARRLLAARDGSLWIATYDGVYRLAAGAAKPVRLQARDAAGAGVAVDGMIHALAEAPDGAVWVGTAMGLFRHDAGNADLRRVPAAAGRGLAGPVVIGLLFDRQGSLWADTAVAGLHRMTAWDGAQASFDRISERHGSIGKPFGANLLEDGRGRIWTQLNVYDPATDRLDEIGAADGVRIGMPWFSSYAQLPDGRMLFGGSRGLLVVRPEAFEPPSELAPLQVSQLTVDGKSLPAGVAVQGVTLQPGQRRVSVEFVALEFGEPERVRYAYRLDGFDADWQAADADLRLASYANLAPGQYLLRIRAANRSGAWGAEELRVPLRVLPAWWQQWWARALLGLGLLTLMWAGVRWRTSRLLVLQRQLEEKVRQRTAALEESSLTDPLTGMRNRRFLTQHIAQDCATVLRRHADLGAGQAAPADADLVFFLVDVDHFKRVNDELGHAAGDAVLMQMRGRLQPVFREADHLVRWGGEEFLIVARATSRVHAAELAERARAMVAATPFSLPGGGAIGISCSIGFACFPLATAQPRALDWSAVIALADSALFAAKAAGRNRWMGVLGVQGGGTSLDVAKLQNLAPRSLAQWADIAPLETVSSQDRP